MLFLHTITHLSRVIEFCPIDLEGNFPLFEYLFLGNMPFHFKQPVPPQHPLQTIKWSS